MWKSYNVYFDTMARPAFLAAACRASKGSRSTRGGCLLIFSISSNALQDAGGFCLHFRKGEEFFAQILERGADVIKRRWAIGSSNLNRLP